MYKPLQIPALLVLILLLVACMQPDDDEKPAGLADASTRLTHSVAAREKAMTQGESVILSHGELLDSGELTDDKLTTQATDQGWQAARFTNPGDIAAYPQRAGNPEAGRRALLEEAYVSCGLPERVYRQLFPHDFEPVVVEGRSAEADGLPYDVNVFTNDEDIKIVGSNCLACHGTPLFGELVIGLGNEFLDFTVDASLLVERAGAFVQGAAESAAWELYADRINAIAPHIKTSTLGANPANNLTFALIAHRRASDNAWSDEPLLPLPPTQVPPVSVPPWWRMAKKTAMFNLGEGRRDHARIMMAASMLCSDTVEELEEIDAYAPDIRAFIASLSPPEYPFPIDQAKAETGREVFEANCSQCHGRYGAQPNYPAKLVPLEIVQTDSSLVDFAFGDGVPYIDWFNRSYYGQLSTAAPGAGYVAPPLDGVWATAPFLHNGSVPTIQMLLNSAERPRYWRHLVSDASDPQTYDQQRLGWLHEELEQGKNGASDVTVYDTDQPGYANTGHQFGDHLDTAQRAAVIEYLKTL